MGDQTIDKVRADLVLLVRQEGLPVGAFWGKSSYLLADEAGLVHSNHNAVAQQLESLSLVRLAFLGERGIRGAELDAQLAIKRDQQRPPEPRMSEADYRALVASMEMADFRDAQRYLDAHDEKARNAGKLVGRFIREPAADGFAIYVVTETKGDQVRLRTVPVGTDLVVPSMGPDAWLSRSYVENKVNQGDARHEVLSKRAQP